MAQVFKVDVVLPYITDLPRDVAVNTFHFQWGEGDPTGPDAIPPALEAFYNETKATGASLASFISAYVKRDADACRMDLYGVPATPPIGPRVTGPPLGSSSFTLEPSADTESLPFEVALCISEHSNFVAVPKARQRGRQYIGPLAFGAINPNANDPSRPTDLLRETLVECGSDLMADTGLAAADIQWGVWSNGSAVAPSTNSAFYPITGGWVDNEWDTQRRRGTEANVRTTF